MNHRFSFALIALGFGASLLTGCGGRYQIQRDVDDDTVSVAGRGSDAGSAGSTSAQAGSSTGSSGSGSVGLGGTGSVGASGSSSAGAGTSGSCGTVKCGATTCPAGASVVLLAGACCPTCVATCGPCFNPVCVSGSHLELLPGACCPSCVADGAAACQMGLQAYDAQRVKFLDKYQYGCASNSECVTLAPVNSCEQGCSYAAVWYGAADSFETNLSNAADQYCASCQMGPIPPCVPPPAARCVKGQCQLASK